MEEHEEPAPRRRGRRGVTNAKKLLSLAETIVEELKHPLDVHAKAETQLRIASLFAQRLHITTEDEALDLIKHIRKILKDAEVSEAVFRPSQLPMAIRRLISRARQHSDDAS